MPALYFDLDGTLVDVRQRHYAAYADTVRALGLEPIAAGAYWHRRRRGASSADLLEHGQPWRESFLEGWVARVESTPYLDMDEPVPGAFAALDVLRETYALVLVTLRRDRATLTGQLKRLGLEQRFDAILTPASTDETKADLIARSSPPSAASFVVGDSEADVEAARALALRSVCVRTGVRDAQFLRALGPDVLIDSVATLPEALRARWPAPAQSVP